MSSLADQLVRYLETNGYVGRNNPIVQQDAAAEIGCPVRELQEIMSEVDELRYNQFFKEEGLRADRCSLCCP